MFLKLLKVNPKALLFFNLKPSEMYDYSKQLNFEGFVILENAKLELLNHLEINQTTNVLFIHPEKVSAYAELFK